MGGHGHRNMYYATGLPGWVRFGYSPGWGGIPPAAQYLQSTGQMDAFLASLGSPASRAGDWTAGTAAVSKEQEFAALNAQKEALERQMEALKKRLDALEKEA